MGPRRGQPLVSMRRSIGDQMMSRLFDRRAVVGGLAGGAIGLAARPGVAGALQRNQQGFSFTVLGDWGLMM